MDSIIIERASALLGIPKTNIKSIFRDKTDDEAIKLLYDIESTSMISISQRLNLDKIYNSFVTEFISETVLGNIDITDDTFTNEHNMELFRQCSKNAITKLVEWFQENNKSIKVHYCGKNITSRCSKLPHVPHYDINNKTFCCGVNGDIEIVDHTIRITSVIDKVKGNKKRYSAMKGAYRIQIIERG